MSSSDLLGIGVFGSGLHWTRLSRSVSISEATGAAPVSPNVSMKYTILVLLLVAAAGAAWYGYVLAHLPERVGTYATSSELFQSKCIQNLKNIANAKSAWARDHPKATNAAPTDSELFGPNLYLHENPACLKGGPTPSGPSPKHRDALSLVTS